MKSEDLYYIGTHKDSFRSGEAGRVIAMRMLTPDGGTPRPCFLVQYADYYSDYCAVADTANYKLVSESEVRLKRMPL